MYRVTVAGYNGEQVVFSFNRLVDALNFSETCLECGDDGIMVSITGITEQKGEN